MDKYKKELEEKLFEMNTVLADANMDLELVIVGGAAFVLKELIPRATTDFDFIKSTNQKAIALLTAHGFDVNGRVDTYFYQFGIDWDQDLELLIKMSNIIVKTISTERLMISKLFSDKRHEDFEESIKNKNIDQEKFEDILEDVYSIVYEMSPRNFKENMYMIKNLYKKKGWDYESSNAKNLCEQ